MIEAYFIKCINDYLLIYKLFVNDSYLRNDIKNILITACKMIPCALLRTRFH